MAKYEDYVKDDLNEEINEAAGAAEERRQESTIPERFRGKSAEEIAAAYAELESLAGRQGQELGVLRKAVDTIQAQRQPTEQPAKAPERKPVTVDEIYDNADESIRRVVREESQSRIEELERRLQEADRRAALAVFESKHPDYRSLVQDAAFTDWIKGSPYRVRQAMAADQGDLDAADDLFSTYAEVSGAKKQAQTTQSRRAAVREASLETSGGNAPAPVEKFSRSKLESMRIRARRGDPEAERYMQANGEDILRAYAEGRLTN